LLILAESVGMFNFRRKEIEVDSSLFDAEQDMDLIIMIEKARTHEEIQSVIRMSRSRMRARRHQHAVARRPHAAEATRARGSAAPSSTLRGF
jgi:hypothetical protein